MVMVMDFGAGSVPRSLCAGSNFQIVIPDLFVSASTLAQRTKTQTRCAHRLISPPLTLTLFCNKFSCRHCSCLVKFWFCISGSIFAARILVQRSTGDTFSLARFGRNLHLFDRSHEPPNAEHRNRESNEGLYRCSPERPQ